MKQGKRILHSCLAAVLMFAMVFGGVFAAPVTALAEETVTDTSVTEPAVTEGTSAAAERKITLIAGSSEEESYTFEYNATDAVLVYLEEDFVVIDDYHPVITTDEITGTQRFTISLAELTEALGLDEPAYGNYLVNLQTADDKLIEAECVFKPTAEGILTVVPNETQKVVSMKLSNASMNGGIEKVTYRVYKKGNEEQSVSLDAKEVNGVWTLDFATDMIAKYGFGTYMVEANATSVSGEKKTIGTGSFSFSIGTATIAIANKSASKGTFEVVVSDIKTPGNLKKVAVTITANGKSKSYTAAKQSGGYYLAKVNAADFKNFSGTYNVRVNAALTNGLTGRFGTTKLTFKPTVKNGWYYEKYNGKTYKFYYEKNEKVTDLTKVLGLKPSSGVVSNSKYYIELNRAACVATVYYYDTKTKSYCIPIKSFTVSVGANTWSNAGASALNTSTSFTPLGNFSICKNSTGKSKFSMKPMYEPNGSTVYARWASHVVGNVYFHSIAVGSDSHYALNPNTFNKLGTACSAGCIRMQVADAKWIYDYVSVGSKVKVVKGSASTPGPYGKPATIKIKSSSVRYDPTDPAVSDSRKAADYKAGKITGYMKKNGTKVGYK